MYIYFFYRKNDTLVSSDESVHSNVQAYAKLRLPLNKAFVPQDDRLHGFYTTRSYLQHYARLSGLTRRQSVDQVNARIEDLCINLDCRNRRIPL